MNAYRQLTTIVPTQLDDLLHQSHQHLVLLMFTADWCMPCRLFANSLQQIQRDNVNTVRCYKIDSEQAVDLAAQWQISSLPTLCWLYQGQLFDRSLGLLPVAHLQARIDQCLSRGEPTG